MHGGRCKHCCNWHRHGEQSQGRDLQASANLLCVRADCCSFALCRQSWRASKSGGFNLIFMAGRISPGSHPSPCCSQGTGGWLGTWAVLVALPQGGPKAQGQHSGVGTGPPAVVGITLRCVAASCPCGGHAAAERAAGASHVPGPLRGAGSRRKVGMAEERFPIALCFWHEVGVHL